MRNPPHARARRRIVAAILAVLLLPAVPAAAAPPKVGSFTSYVDELPRHDPQTFCTSKAQPGVVDFRRLVLTKYPKTRNMGITRSCSVGGRSEHKEGRAWDWGVKANNSREKAYAKELIDWLLATDKYGNKHAMARRFGIQYLIWNRRIWSPSGGWRAYNGVSPHTDHVHFSFTWEGARRRTTYWTRATAPSPKYRWQLTAKLDGTGMMPRWYGGSGRTDNQLLVGDINRDRLDDLAIFRNGKWFVRNLATGVRTDFTYGKKPGDEALLGDWNGNGKATPMIRRGDRWLGRNKLASGATTIDFRFGSPGGKAVVGDWNGDGRDEVGVWKDGTFTLITKLATGAKTQEIPFGRRGDVPVAGDWNRNGTDTVGVVRGNQWLLRTKPGPGKVQLELTHGRRGEFPIAGDWTGDGRSTPGSIRP